MVWRKVIRVVVIVALLLLLTLLPLSAEPHEPFSGAELDRFISDWPDYVAWAEAGDEKAQRRLIDRGWRVERFFHIANQVSAGLVELEAAELRQETARRTEQQRAAIQQSPHLSQEQKERMIARLEEESAESPVSGQPPGHGIAASELALIGTRHDELKQILKIDY